MWQNCKTLMKVLPGSHGKLQGENPHHKSSAIGRYGTIPCYLENLRVEIRSVFSNRLLTALVLQNSSSSKNWAIFKYVCFCNILLLQKQTPVLTVYVLEAISLAKGKIHYLFFFFFLSSDTKSVVGLTFPSGIALVFNLCTTTTNKKINILHLFQSKT